MSDVAEMEKKLGGRKNTKEERVEMMREELQEFIDAKEKWDELDALVDLIWFAVGTAFQSDYPLATAWERVAKANFAKIPGITKRRMTVDLVKPPGWQPPDLRSLFERPECQARRCGYYLEGTCMWDGSNDSEGKALCQ